MSPLLSVSNVSINFGGIQALDGVSFEIQEGQVFGLIGPNGAGKTTVFNVLSRIYRPDSGSVTFNGKNLLKTAPHRVPAIGIARTFQNVILFPVMNVMDNVLVGGHSWMLTNPLLSMVRWPRVRRDENKAREKAARLLDYLDLTSVAERGAGDLPFPTRKRIELARALMSDPKLLLLDEPAGGLTHQEVTELGDLIQRIRKDLGVTILLVEHHMALVMGICEHVCVLDFGRKISEGDAQHVQQDPAVIRAYLGEAPEEKTA